MCQIATLSYGVGLKSNQKVFSYSHDCTNEHAFPASHYCSSQGLQLDMLDDYFSPVVAHIAPSNSMQDNQ